MFISSFWTEMVICPYFLNFVIYNLCEVLFSMKRQVFPYDFAPILLEVFVILPLFWDQRFRLYFDRFGGDLCSYIWNSLQNF